MSTSLFCNHDLLLTTADICHVSLFLLLFLNTNCGQELGVTDTYTKMIDLSSNHFQNALLWCTLKQNKKNIPCRLQCLVLNYAKLFFLSFFLSFFFFFFYLFIYPSFSLSFFFSFISYFLLLLWLICKLSPSEEDIKLWTRRLLQYWDRNKKEWADFIA
jgi:hypothetical protein